MKKKFVLVTKGLFYTFLTFFCFSSYVNAQDSSLLVRAGLRSSTYGFGSGNFPDSSWWFNATNDMAARFSGASPTVIWILGYTTNNGCYLGFPNPTPGTSYDKIFFASTDRNEAYLNAFDKNGIKVWLQIEPGNADIPTLIDLVLNRYKHHSCIIGFGVDVEWYRESEKPGWGMPVTDNEAEVWEQKVKSYNQDYKLFLKHWDRDWMPPSYRGDIVFLSDSQDLSSLNAMINEFTTYWANYFKPSNVGFQVGYKSDKTWWSTLADPPKNIGDEILKKSTNTTDLFWVDFTAYDIWPKGFTPTSVIYEENNYPADFCLYQNYPNPFNPETVISYQLPVAGHVSLVIYDVLGKEITTLVNEEQSAGSYRVSFNSIKNGSLTSGIYFAQLKSRSFSKSIKLLLIK